MMHTDSEPWGLPEPGQANILECRTRLIFTLPLLPNPWQVSADSLQGIRIL